MRKFLSEVVTPILLGFAAFGFVVLWVLEII